VKDLRPALARAADAFRVPSPRDALAQAQSLMTALADLDGAYASDLATVRNSDVAEMLKQQVMSTLEQRHRERRARVLRRLEAIQRRAAAAA
jgi:hypothetical protein